MLKHRIRSQAYKIVVQTKREPKKKTNKDEAKRANKEITVPEIQHNLNSMACALYQKCIRIAVHLS